MYADGATIASQIEMPAQFTIVQASDSETIQQYGAVLGRLFGDSVEATYVRAYYQRISELPLPKLVHMPCFLGYYDGEVVSAGSLFVDEETVGIYDIATRAAWRKQGFGMAMFRYLLSNPGNSIEDTACCRHHLMASISMQKPVLYPFAT